MSISKNAYFRYKIIDTCLRQTYRRYNWESLLEALSQAVKDELGIEKGISRRTLFLDLKQMQKEPPEGFGAPIDLDVDNNYFYTDPDFSISNCPLVEEDANKLHEALVILKQLSGLPQFEDIENIIRKLEHKSGLKGTPGKQIIEFDRVENSKGTKYIQVIYNAIQQNRVLKIDYKPFHHDKSYLISFHPYLLKQSNNRWFVFGFNHELKSIATVALDRIESINLSQEKYIQNTFFSANEYFENIVGVTLPKEKKVVAIHARLKKPRAFYLLTKPLHPSQQVLKDTKSHIVFQWKLIPNLELTSLLLSYGDDLVVLKPIELAAEVKEGLKKAIENYI